MMVKPRPQFPRHLGIVTVFGGILVLGMPSASQKGKPEADSKEITSPTAHCEPVCYVGERPACEVTWAPHVSAVFLGTVLDVVEENGQTTRVFRATMTVDKTFLGTDAKTVTLVSGGGSCGGVPFSKGTSWLVYANFQNDGTFAVALCGGTKPAAQAGEDIKYLSTLASRSKTSAVFGTAYRYTEPEHSNPKILRLMHPLAGQKVMIRSQHGSYETLIKKDGNFEVDGLDPDEYVIDILVSDPTLAKTSSGFTWLYPPNEHLPLRVHASGCARIDLVADPFHKDTKSSALK